MVPEDTEQRGEAPTEDGMSSREAVLLFIGLWVAGAIGAVVILYGLGIICSYLITGGI